MNNEIEQIAQQNDMSVEFVTWFFDEKKSACGEHWFLMLGAMWEGWKARSIEMDRLAAENVAMKSNAIKARRVIMSSKFDYWSDRVELFEVVRLINETPATDRIVAEAEARGVEKFAAKLRIPGNDQFFDALAKGVAIAADDFAKQLREGADK